MGIFVRPRLFKAEPSQPEEVVADEEQQSPQRNSPTPMTATDVVYVKIDGAVKGVLQLHKAACPTKVYMIHASSKAPLHRLFTLSITQVAAEDNILGYRVLFRSEEVWALAKRSQKFYNWFTKLFLFCRLPALMITLCQIVI